MAPPPAVSRATFAEEVARIKATPLDRAAEEIAMSLYGPTRDADPVPAAVEEMLADAAAALNTLTAALRQCWDTFMAPHWGRLSDLLDADVAYRTRQIGDKGLRWMLADLHPAVAWHGDDLRIDRPIDEHRRLGGAGLVLMPSVFVWPNLAAVVDPPWQPTLVYPARGIAELWQPVATDRSEPLARLLGATRATLLASLEEPASTTALARRHGLSPATVSDHLSVLERAGLLAKRRRGKSVLYRQTDIGAALTGAEASPRQLF
ncbi:MAG TPA: DUF5937 family protein [Acidimicrobiales bacterium]|nr:DUF5937 family protein [Acidimicrobiales bacterium]